MATFQIPTFEAMAEAWPSPVVARNKVQELTGGLVTPNYLANLDSQGLGPAGRFKCGGKVGYPVDSFIEWLVGRTEVY
jgi:hypothetical protein